MRLLKQLGKQLGFLVLAGTTMFSASPISAQNQVFVNTDFDINKNFIKSVMFPSNPTLNQIDVVQIGGIVQANVANIAVEASIFDPFGNNYYNGESVGGSAFAGNIIPAFPFNEARGIFNEIPGNTLRISLDFGPNLPALNSGNTVRIHYGYTQTFNTAIVPDPKFVASFVEFRDVSNGATSPLRYSMLSPCLPRPGGFNCGNAVSFRQMDTETVQVSRKTAKVSTKIAQVNQETGQEDTPTEYLTVQYEQTDPANPGVRLVSTIQFPVAQGEIPPNLVFNNYSDSTVTLENNVQFVRTNRPIPLFLLTEIGLSAIGLQLQPIPSLGGDINPGETVVSSETLETPVQEFSEIDFIGYDNITNREIF